MSSGLFKVWSDGQFVPKVKEFVCSKGLPVKARLLLDDASSHPNEKILQCGEIITMYFLANVTSLTQPRHQNEQDRLYKTKQVFKTARHGLCNYVNFLTVKLTRAQCVLTL